MPAEKRGSNFERSATICHADASIDSLGTELVPMYILLLAQPTIWINVYTTSSSVPCKGFMKSWRVLAPKRGGPRRMMMDVVPRPHEHDVVEHFGAVVPAPFPASGIIAAYE